MYFFKKENKQTKKEKSHSAVVFEPVPLFCACIFASQTVHVGEAIELEPCDMILFQHALG